MTCKDCIHYKACEVWADNYGNIGSFYIDMAQDVESSCKRFQQGWISVKDRLPKECEDVLVKFESGNMAVCFLRQ